MAKINCPSYLDDQNLEGFQLEGQIWYRAIKLIPIGRELLVWYGRGYAMVKLSRPMDCSPRLLERRLDLF